MQKVRKGSRGLLSIVLLVFLASMQVRDYQDITMACQPWLTIWSHQDPYVTSQGDGRFPEELFRISTEMNHKMNNETEVASLAPENGYGHHVLTINYLSFF
ncbi:neuronal regeneration-related protein-like [Rhinatrema bivittatum]|uniref:neuronal regeneration-related protein-like n=1 Tax=Rhinatrema bivittatum TaxID=194408 RepID=UPI001125E6EB|nr:neuronal regeneration-related protein-like [Rhinatrema bivittatum]